MVDIFSQTSSSLPSYCLEHAWQHILVIISISLLCGHTQQGMGGAFFPPLVLKFIVGLGWQKANKKTGVHILMKGSGQEKTVTQKLWISDVSSREKDFQAAGFESSSGSRHWTHRPSHGLFPAWFAAVGMGRASRSWSEPNFCPGMGMVHLTNSKSYPGCICRDAAYGTGATPPPCSPVPGASGSPRGPWSRGCCSTRPGMLGAPGLAAWSSCSRSRSDPTLS